MNNRSLDKVINNYYQNGKIYKATKEGIILENTKKLNKKKIIIKDLRELK